MNYKDAFWRAVRTSAQTLAASLVALPTISSFSEIQLHGSLWGAALYTAALAGVVSFLQNIGESGVSTMLKE